MKKRGATFDYQNVKKENSSDKEHVPEEALGTPTDEINLEEIPDRLETNSCDNNLVKIKGEFKNPRFKSWDVVDPQKESKLLWEILEEDNKVKGIKEIGDGSTCFEHCIEFWGTWKINKPGVNRDFLSESRNWPSGVTILEVENA